MPAPNPDARALRHLRRADPILHAALLPHRAALARTAGPATRVTRTTLFGRLVSSIASQQLSTKAADTIIGRLRLACGGRITPAAVRALGIEGLRSTGLSGAKAKAIAGLAEAALDGTLDLLALRTLPEADAVRVLSAHWGVGRWTAEMFLMFALEREDVFSPGDLGLRRAMETLYGLPKDCPIAELEAIALRWSPHRTYASRALWRIRDSG